MDSLSPQHMKEALNSFPPEILNFSAFVCPFMCCENNALIFTSAEGLSEDVLAYVRYAERPAMGGNFPSRSARRVTSIYL